jgi:hypothetical protein
MEQFYRKIYAISLAYTRPHTPDRHHLATPELLQIGSFAGHKFLRNLDKLLKPQHSREGLLSGPTSSTFSSNIWSRSGDWLHLSPAFGQHTTGACPIQGYSRFPTPNPREGNRKCQSRSPSPCVKYS